MEKADYGNSSWQGCGVNDADKHYENTIPPRHLGGVESC